MHTKFLSALLVIGLLAVFSSAASAAQPAGQIKSVHLKGEVYVTDKATTARTLLTDGATLTQGSIVTTAKYSSVVLVFSNGATLNLGSDSVLDIETFTQDPFTTGFKGEITAEPTTSTTKINLTRGELVSKVAKLNTKGGSTFTVGTPVGAAGIRGTIFRIVYIPDGNGHATFSLLTLQGSVYVTLVTGTVTAPPVVVSGGKEVALTVDINVDATGASMVTLPAGTTTPTAATNASPAATAQVTAAAQDAAQAVINIVTPPTPATAQPVVPPPAVVTPLQTINTSISSPSS